MRPTAHKPEELLVEFGWIHVTFENGVGIADGKVPDGDSTREITLKGPMADGKLKYGLSYHFFGRWKKHYKHGMQFVFSHFSPAEPAGKRAVIRYLQTAPWIGGMTARILWDEYNSKAVEMVRTSPGKVASIASQFTPARARMASEYLCSQQALEHCTMELFGLLDKRRVRKTVIPELIERYGNNAPEIVRMNPHILRTFRGIGFPTADAVYLDLKKDPARRKRQTLCISHDLETDRGGHTWFPAEKAREVIREQVGGAQHRVRDALLLGRRAGVITIRKDADKRIWLAHAPNAANEATIARLIVEAEQETPEWPDVDRLTGLTSHQREMVTESLKGVIGILGGSPGTGKTFTAAQLIKIISDAYSHLVAVCAPTGKAAVRITEVLLQAGVKIQATTTHRLLGIEQGDTGGYDGSGWSFIHNERNPLPHKWIFRDERSMVDTDIDAALLKARAHGTHLIDFGDINQLSPVGHGAPMRDLIAAGVPYGELTEIHRQVAGSRIVQACAELRDTGRFRFSRRLDLPNENLVLRPCRSPMRQIMEIERIIQGIGKKGKYDPKWDVQVLCAVNEKSLVGRKNLNKRLQKMLNSNGVRAQGNPFAVGDKIICTRNGKLPAKNKHGPEADDDGRVVVANGELAEVLEVTPALTVARLMAPERVVIIPRGQEEGSTGCNWELGYAISGHKSQGSEWPIVIVVVDEYSGASWVCDRSWIYTAISRAKVCCICVGRQTRVDEFCSRSFLGRRKTFLRELIEEQRNAQI